MPKQHHGIHPAQEAIPTEWPPAYGPEGSFVDLDVRAEHLVEALGALGQRNMRHGFDTASNEKTYNRPIRERYTGALRAVQMGAEDNAELFEGEAKKGLWRATGYIALRTIKPRLISNRAIDAGGRKMWRDFDAAYGHASHSKDRDKYKRKLVRTIKQTQNTIEHQAA